MDSVLNCFGDIIGLTPSDPSDSGLYISDLEAVSTVEGLIVEDGKTVEEIMNDALRVAILTTNADLTALMMKYASVKPSISGKIGNSRWTRKAKGGAELIVVCKPLRNATFHVYDVGAIFLNAGVKQVRMTSNIGHDEVFNITITPEKMSSVTTSLTLPMYSDLVDFVEYTFSHDEDYCVAKMETCGSCSFKFNYLSPRFTNKGISSYVMSAGKCGDTYVNSSSGLVLNVGFSCDISNVVCNELIDFTHNPAAQSIAQAVQYKAGSVVVWKCLRNPNLNRVLMEDAADLRDAARYYERRYREMVGFINLHRAYDHDCVCEKRRAGWRGRIR